MVLQIYRGDFVNNELPVYDTFLFNKTLMQEHRITISNLVLITPLDIQLNDYIIYNSVRYTVNTVPNLTIDNKFNYTIIFEGPEYRLYDKLMMDEGSADFTYFGTAEEHLQLMLDNINSIDAGWTMGTIDPTEPMFIPYSNVTCRVALGQIADSFKLEYDFNNKQINLIKQAGNVTTHVFEYGMDKGLYSLTRNFVNEKNVKTKVYGFGSARNLPANYRGMGTPRLTFEEKFIQRNADIYGVKETQYTDEEIFPTREGVINAVSNILDDDKTFTVTDSTLDFNINNFTLPSAEAKISFTTGEMTGEEFVIIGYNNATKVITCKSKTNSASIKLPSSTFKPEVGDKYVLLDISLPQTYIDAAEAKVKEGTIIYTDQNAVPQVEYGLDMDIIFVRDYGVNLQPGDIVRVKNPALGIDDEIRVISVSYPISFPEELTQNTKYSVTIANFISYTIQERLTAEVLANKKVIKLVDRRSVELARRNTNNFRDLQDAIYDPDGFFDNSNIKPNSISTLLLAVGAKSQNFRLNGAVFTLNHEGDENAMNVTNGVLEHFEIEIAGLGYSWVIPTKLFIGMNPLKHYYVYAKCSTASLTGEWMISDVPVFTEETAGYYNFNIGIVYKVRDGYRDCDFTYGQTSIVGDNITTGRIKDITGQNYLDLKTGQFNLGDDENGINFNKNNDGKLEVKGGVTSGSLLVGDDNGLVNAGLSGKINPAPNEDKSVFIWGGAEEAEKDTAPFRVDQSGKLWAENAYIRGDIGALTGNIAGFKIGTEGLTNEDNNAFIALKKTVDTTHEIGLAAGIGVPSDYFGSDSVSAKSVINIKNTVSAEAGVETPNVGINIDVANGDGNYAINVQRGAVSLQKGANIIVQKDDNSLALGVGDFEADVRVGGTSFVKMRFVKGILVYAAPV